MVEAKDVREVKRSAASSGRKCIARRDLLRPPLDQTSLVARQDLGRVFQPVDTSPSLLFLVSRVTKLLSD